MKHLFVPLFLLPLLSTLDYCASPYKWKRSHNKDAGAYVGVDKLRPTTDTTPLKIQNKAGDSDIMIIDLGSMQIGIKKTPTQDLDVEGAVKAGSFIGDGSQITGISVTGAATPSFISTASNYTIQTKERVIVDSFITSVDLTPPATATGAWFEVLDAGNASANNIRILTNGVKINGSTNNLLIDMSLGHVKMVYLNSAQGWVVKAP